MSSADDSPGDGAAAGGMRASDAERDATVERLSQATGDGPGAPTVHVRAFSLVGGIRVRRSRDV